MGQNASSIETQKWQTDISLSQDVFYSEFSPVGHTDGEEMRFQWRNHEDQTGEDDEEDRFGEMSIDIQLDEILLQT